MERFNALSRNARNALGCGALIVLCLVVSFCSWALQVTGFVEPPPTPAPISWPPPASFLTPPVTPATRPTQVPRPTHTSASPLAAECVILGEDVIADIYQQNGRINFANEIYIAASPREHPYLAGAYQRGDGISKSETTVAVYRHSDTADTWESMGLGRFSTDADRERHAKALACGEWARDEYGQ